MRHIRFQGVVTDPSGGSRLPPRLVVHTVRPALQQPAPSQGSFGREVLLRAGLDPEAYRDAPILRRTNACWRALHVRGEDDARSALSRGGDALDRALNTMLLGVSGFFRDREVFDTLRDQIVPRLAARGEPVRVLSVGCSNGAELYSVGVLLDEAGALARSQLVGIDCRARAIDSAIRAIYPTDVAEAVPEAWRARAFRPVAGGVQVADHLRERAAFEVRDATAGVPAGPWHLVLCRNLIIYLRAAATQHLLDAIVDRLAPGGTLVLGKAERPAASMRLSAIGRCVYRRHD